MAFNSCLSGLLHFFKIKLRSDELFASSVAVSYIGISIKFIFKVKNKNIMAQIPNLLLIFAIKIYISSLKSEICPWESHFWL